MISWTVKEGLSQDFTSWVLLTYWIFSVMVMHLLKLTNTWVKFINLLTNSCFKRMEIDLKL